MNRPLVILRPEPGLGETLAGARALGLEAVASPLFQIQALEWNAPEPRVFDALLAGSANAFRMGGARLAGLRALPVLAVGQKTADAARAAGFRVDTVGEGGLQHVLDGLEAPMRLLRLAGEERVSLVPPAGTTIAEVVVYRAAPLDLSRDAIDALSRGAVAAVHSGLAAQRFTRECERWGIDRAGVAIAVLAPRIAAQAGNGWAAVATADKVDETALLALAAQMCQTPAINRAADAAGR